MKENEVNNYNTAVLQAIRYQYRSCNDERYKTSEEIDAIIDRLENEADTLSYNEYKKLVDRGKSLREKYAELLIKVCVWDQAREICLNLVDAMCKED